jgi:hypothetical protein
MILLEFAAALAGAAIVVATVISVAATVVVPRGVRNWLTALIERGVDAVFRTLTRRIDDLATIDRVLAVQAPCILSAQLLVWLLCLGIGYGLALWPFTPEGLGRAMTEAGSSMFTLGFVGPSNPGNAVIAFLAAASGLIVIALQIAYLPTIYAAFSRREAEVTLLIGRAGVPTWGPELLARTRYGLGNNLLTRYMPEVYLNWERWAADVQETHTTYPVLVRFRSPRPLSSWLTALLGVLDSAALYLTLNPSSAPAVEARLCLRMGFVCLRQIAGVMGVPYDDDPDPDDGIQLTYEEFKAGTDRMVASGWELEVPPEDAWPEFIGWRVNYEAVAYAIAAEIDAVPALWSGPRRRPLAPIPPVRPAIRRRTTKGG